MLLPRNHHLQMSSCLAGGGGGGGRAYAIELEILKSPSPSPSSTLSESSNSGLAIASRKPRTPRKRPNQTYNEAAALLSTVYPKVFSAATVAAANSRILSKSPFSSSSSSSSFSSDDSSELFFPFRIVDDDCTFLISEKPSTVRAIERSKFSNSSNSSSTLSEKSCPSPGEFDSREVNFRPRPMDLDCEEAAEDDFDYSAESILDEEVDDGGGIDSIMGNLTVESTDDRTMTENTGNTCYGYPMGLGLALGFELGFGIQRGGFVRALRHGYDANYGDNNWWSFPTVDIGELSPRFRKPSEKKAKKKMKKVAAVVEREKAKAKAAEEHHAAAAAVSGACEPKSLELPETTGAGLGLLLKLNYDGVLRAWSDKGSPFSDDGDAPVGSQNDVAVGSLSSSARKSKCGKEKEKIKK